VVALAALALSSCAGFYDRGTPEQTDEWCAEFEKFSAESARVGSQSGPPSEAQAQAVAGVEVEFAPRLAELAQGQKMRDALATMEANANWTLGQGSEEPDFGDVAEAYSTISYAGKIWCGVSEPG
jgi:hypothetical protein